MNTDIGKGSVEDAEDAKSPETSSEERELDADLALTDERPLQDQDADDSWTASTPEQAHDRIVAILNGGGTAAEAFFSQHWTGAFDSPYAHPARNQTAMNGKVFGFEVPMLRRNDDGTFEVKARETARFRDDCKVVVGSRDSLPQEDQERADRIAHTRPGFQERFVAADGEHHLKRLDKEVLQAQKELAEAGGDPAKGAKAQQNLDIARENRARGPVEVAEAAVRRAQGDQVAAVTARVYQTSWESWPADVDPQQVREAGEEWALSQKYTGESKTKEAELRLAEAKHEYAQGEVEQAGAALAEARRSGSPTDEAESALAAAHERRATAATDVRTATSARDAAKDAEEDFAVKLTDAHGTVDPGARLGDTGAEFARTDKAVEAARTARAEAEQSLAAAPPTERARAAEAVRGAEAELVVARYEERRARNAHLDDTADRFSDARRSPSPDVFGGDGADERADHAQMRNYFGEFLGHIAIEHRIADLEKDISVPPLRTVAELPDRGAGHLDVVLELDDGQRSPQFRIYEVKGASAGRGTSGGFEQGHPEYLDRMLKGLHERAGAAHDRIDAALKSPEGPQRDKTLGDLRSEFKTQDLGTAQKAFAAERDKAAEIIEAREQDEKGQVEGDQRRVRYFQVQAQVEDSDLRSRYKGHVEKEYDLSARAPKKNTQATP
ncbi:hypothetical protein SK854_36405 [Lentzea sp. BCCO 10_0061]|uniref:Uncharacterized protein n=1 Tax=Lentzea sokolovensis TaxID=3095429 RepID=A0ABU4V770_9PSEU|nr:hypothetical protein [Lentzea sp. BCCO 10_0061]MDX8147641.1 hypothetical protein [Lentzea sp. BCCO 10_0061]